MQRPAVGSTWQLLLFLELLPNDLVDSRAIDLSGSGTLPGGQSLVCPELLFST